eukprot:jgi/Astpho2/9714/fgenesh1_pg.00149_%23_10_t
MAEELESLGGGDARLGHLTDAVQWLLEGFNSAVITFGQAATGKSLALFGAGQQLEQPLLLSMLKDLFRQARSSADYRVGMACWELQDGRVRGLLATDQPAGSDHGSCAGFSTQHACVEVASLSDAQDALQQAQLNSVNWATNSSGRLQPVSNRAHFFLQLQLYNRRGLLSTQHLSMLHVVDLAGSHSLSGGSTLAGGAADIGSDEALRQQEQRERRATNQELLGVTRMITALAQAQTAGASGSSPAVSARDSRLLEQVTPLLAGNCRTFLLACVSPHAAEYLDSLNTLRIASRAQGIKVAQFQQQQQQGQRAQSFEQSAPGPLELPAKDRDREDDLSWQTVLNAAGGHQGSIPEGSAAAGLRAEGSFSFHNDSSANAPAAVSDDLKRHSMAESQLDNTSRLLEDLKAEDSETAEELEQQLGRLKQEFQQLYSCTVDEQRQGPRHATAWERERAVARRARAVQSMQQQGPGRLVDQVLQQLQDVGLSAGELGARARHGSPASSPPCREALRPSSAVNQASPQGQTGVPMPQRVSEQQLHGVILAGAPGTSGSWDGGRPSAARALRFPHAHARPHGGSPVAGYRPQKAAASQSAGRDGDAAGAVSYNSRVQQQGQLLHRRPPARESSLSLAELVSAPQAAADSPSAAAISQQHQHGSLAQQQQGQEPGLRDPQEVASWAASPPTSRAASPVPSPRSPLSTLHTYDQQGSPSINDMLAGRRVSPDPIPAAAAGGSCRDVPQDHRLRELQVANEALVAMLDREKGNCRAAQERQQELEMHMQEVATQYELQLTESRLAESKLRATCRRLESEGMFAEVFDTYEREIASLQAEARRMQTENVELAAQAAEKRNQSPGRPGSRQQQHSSRSSRAGSPCALRGRGDEAAPVALPPGSLDAQLQGLRRALRKCEGERDAAKAANGDLQRQQRTGELYRKKAEDSIKRVTALQHRLAQQQDELHAQGLAKAEAAASLSALEGDMDFLKQEHESVASLRDQVRVLRSQKRRDVVLANLPPVRPDSVVMPRGRNACTAVELCKRLQGAVMHAAAAAERLSTEVQAFLEDRKSMQQREAILLDLLMGNLASVAGKPAMRPPSRATSINV